MLWEPKHYTCLIKFCTFGFKPLKKYTMDGLKIKNGRLMNERPVGMTGIAEASMMRKRNKQRSLTQDIASGIELAEERKMVRDAVTKLFK